MPMRRGIAPVALAAILLLFIKAVECIQTIHDVEQFENVILKSSDIYLVVFTLDSDDPVKSRGVNQERCQEVEEGMPALQVKMDALGVKLAIVDVEDVAAIASEFNVRKRMLPMALLFKTRARDGDVVKADALLDPDHALSEIKEALAENPKREGGGYDKITLQLGGGEL
jgi:thioredoxin-like negative regulator of GroEL